jgi:glycosyltransferase involved in cell wall biosynthesis
MRLVSFHHRLAGMTGHRYPEALGLAAATKARGMEFILFVSKDADAAVRAALPMGRAVLHCPVFRTDLLFDERTADFIAMLHEHLDPVVRKDDWVLVTTGTQCEARALAAWLGEIPVNQRPWAVTLIHSDRWNRYGPEERRRQVNEFRVVASEIAQLDADAKRRFIVGSLTDELCEELGGLLGTVVSRVPQILPSDGYVPSTEKPAHEPPLVGILGGARPEKGSHLIPAVIRASRKLKPIDFAIQLANEQLSAEAFADLCDVQGEPGVEVAHGPLDQKTYRSLLARCDLLLLPYQRTPYKKRTSGIFVEAALTGRPVVVPSGTWMGNQVTAGAAAGTVYDGDDPTAIAAALIRGAEARTTLAILAKKRAPEWQRTMTLNVFLDWLQAEISRRESQGQPRALLKLSGRMKHATLDLIGVFLQHRSGRKRGASDESDPGAR